MLHIAASPRKNLKLSQLKNQNLKPRQKLQTEQKKQQARHETDNLNPPLNSKLCSKPQYLKNDSTRAKGIP